MSHKPQVLKEADETGQNHLTPPEKQRAPHSRFLN
jgi:hypothetical protein